MIKIKNADEIAILKKSGEINLKVHNHLASAIKIGVTTKELDTLAETLIKEYGAVPSFKDYQGFPASICASINNEVVHGIPSSYKLKDRDIIKIDLGILYDGYHTDSARTYIVGNTDESSEKLIKGTKEALMAGIQMVKPDNTIGDISYAIEKVANEYNLGIIKELVGHGAGKELHEDPNIPNYGKPKTGPVLKPGMVLAIEPMLNLGKPDIMITEDGWTIVTKDGQSSAHFEHTVLVTDTGYEILTGE